MSRQVQRGIAVTLAALVLLGGAFVLWIGNRVGEAANLSFCRGCLRQMWRNLDAYTADHDGMLPPYGSDLSAAMAPYSPRREYRCRLVAPGAGPSYTTAPGAAEAYMSDAGSDAEAPMLIETGFRHYHRGKWMMAVVYMDGRAGTATPADLTLPPRPEERGAEPETPLSLHRSAIRR